MTSESTQTPADASALKISVDEKRAAPEFIPLYEGMATVIQNSAAAGKPVRPAERKKLAQLISVKPKASSENKASTVLSTALLKRNAGR